MKTHQHTNENITMLLSFWAITFFTMAHACAYTQYQEVNAVQIMNYLQNPMLNPTAFCIWSAK